MRQNEFIQQHTDDGALSPEHAAQVLEAALSGDTGGTPDKGGEPATPAGEEQGAGSAWESARADSSNPGGAAMEAVILAKDGRHTIPYERLAEAREEARYSRAQAEAAMARLEAVQAEADARMAAGMAPMQAQVDPAMFGDFPEQPLAAGIQHMVDARMAHLAADLQERVDAALEPLRMREADEDMAAHYDESKYPPGKPGVLNHSGNPPALPGRQ